MNYDKKIEKIVEQYIKSTSAECTIKGFLYQLLVTLYKWIDMHVQKKSYEIYPEYYDDICIELEDKVQYIQTKAYDSKNFTLNNVSFIGTINNFCMLHYNGKEKNLLEFIFYTNSQPGNESYLLKKWAKDELTNIEKEQIYLKIKNNLNHSIDRKIYKYNKTIKSYIEKNWLRVIDLIKLNFENKTVDESLDNLKTSILYNIDSLGLSLKRESIFYRLLVEVLDKSIEKIKEYKKINSKLLISILDKSGENIIMDIEGKFNNIENNINKQHEEIKEEIRNSKKEIINEFKNTSVENKKKMTKLIIRSREKIGNGLFQLDLSKFFIKSINDTPSNVYRKIKNEHYWNNDIINDIEVFFYNIKKDIKGEILLDLKNTHTSIAFFIGYRYLKQFCDSMYYIKNEEVYVPEDNYDIDKKWARIEKTINKGNEISIIITPSMAANNITHQVEQFIEKKKIPINKLVTFYLKNKNGQAINSKTSITKENILTLVTCVSNYILDEFALKKINLFLAVPNEFAYLLGRELDKHNNISLYEIKEYGSNEQEYVRTLDMKYINDKFKG